MKGRYIPLIAALAAVLVVVAPSAAAPPAATSVAIERTATLVTPTSLLLRLVVQCPAGTQGSAIVSVSQQQASGPNREGDGNTNITCSGARQTLSVLVFGGPFTPGSAFAGAIVINFGARDTAQDQRVIEIS